MTVCKTSRSCRSGPLSRLSRGGSDAQHEQKCDTHETVSLFHEFFLSSFLGKAVLSGLKISVGFANPTGAFQKDFRRAKVLLVRDCQIPDISVGFANPTGAFQKDFRRAKVLLVRDCQIPDIIAGFANPTGAFWKIQVFARFCSSGIGKSRTSPPDLPIRRELFGILILRTIIVKPEINGCSCLTDIRILPILSAVIFTIPFRRYRRLSQYR